MLGYSENWQEFSGLVSEYEKQGSSEFNTKILAKLNMLPQFSTADQKVVGLFNNPTLKARQDLMILNPQNIVPAEKTECYTEVEAENSSLMDPDVIKCIIELLEKEDKNDHNLRIQKAQVLKAFNTQMNILGQKYIEFLKTNGVIDRLITYLYSSNAQQTDESEIVPLNWIETRI